MRLRDNTVLITGGASGIGRGLAVTLHELGNRVIIAGRSVTRLRAVADAHPGLEYVRLNQSDPDSVEACAADVARCHPTLNVLVNNAAMMAMEDLAAPDLDLVPAVVATNLVGPMLLTSRLLPVLRAQPRAAIVNVTSALAFVPMAAAPTYSATKAGLHAYTESLRVQLRGSAIDVVEIVPPRVRTDMPGPGDDDAMALDDFVASTIALLSRESGTDEIVVGDAGNLRRAERDGTYDVQFAAVNGE
jgi:uncharacterized oxidoreductase